MFKFFKLLGVAVICTAVLSVQGCKDDDPKLSVDVTELSFSSSAESSTITVNSNTSWVITGYPGWVSVSPSSDKDVKVVVVAVNENTTKSERKCTLTVSSRSGKIVKTVQINQEAPEIIEESTQLSVDPKELKFSSAGESKNFKVTSNTAWIITGNPGWVTVSPSSSRDTKVVVVSVAENVATTERKCTLTVSSEDGKLSESVNIVQEATVTTLDVDVSQITLDGKANSSGTLRITSNTNWSIKGASEWLTLSSTNGNGSSSITITANSDNSTASARECTLKLEGGSVSKEIKVSQKGLLAAACNVKPGTVVTLSDGLAFDYVCDPNVVYFYCIVNVPSNLDRITDAELIAGMSGDIEDRLTPSDDLILSWRNLSELTEYVICCIGFDKNGNHGELTKVKVKTKSSRNQAFASISEVYYNDSYWFWTTSVNGFTTRYYQWFIEREDLYYSSDAAIAWFFQEAMKANPSSFPSIVQGDEWHRARNGSNMFHVVTWAKDVDGNFSGVIDRFSGYVDNSDSPAKNGLKIIKKHDKPKSIGKFEKVFKK